MKRDIFTTPISKEQLWQELEFMVNYFINKGFSTCDVLFGFAWGGYYYPGKDWNSEIVYLKDLKNKVISVEVAGHGIFSSNDLFVTFPHMEFRYSDDSDVHIYFTEPSVDTEYFYSKWGSQGFKPAEHITNHINNGPSKKIRAWENA